MEQHVWKIFVAAWVCTAIAVCVGIYFTQSPKCLWAMILPCFLSFSSNNDNGKKSGGEEKCGP